MLQLSPVAAAFKRSPLRAASPAGQPPLRGAARAGNLVLGAHGDRPPHPSLSRTCCVCFAIGFRILYGLTERPDVFFDQLAPEKKVGVDWAKMRAIVLVANTKTACSRRWLGSVFFPVLKRYFLKKVPDREI